MGQKRGEGLGCGIPLLVFGAILWGIIEFDAIVEFAAGIAKSVISIEFVASIINFITSISLGIWLLALMICALCLIAFSRRMSAKSAPTPLHWDAAYGTAETINDLLDGGADIHARDSDGDTPLHSAAFGTAETINALLDAGADINARNNNGFTPLHMAAVNGTEETINALLAADANIHARNENGFTPLHMAAAGMEETINALLAAGANIHARSENGFTSLHMAAAYGTEETINALVGAGANIRQETEDGLIPFDLLEENEAVNKRDKAYWDLYEGRLP